MVAPGADNVDNEVWTNNQEDHSILRVNIKTGAWDNLGKLKDQNGGGINAYDLIPDKMNDLYLLEFGGTKLGEVVNARKRKC